MNVTLGSISSEINPNISLQSHIRVFFAPVARQRHALSLYSGHLSSAFTADSPFLTCLSVCLLLFQAVDIPYYLATNKEVPQKCIHTLADSVAERGARDGFKETFCARRGARWNQSQEYWKRNSFRHTKNNFHSEYFHIVSVGYESTWRRCYTGHRFH